MERAKVKDSAKYRPRTNANGICRLRIQPRSRNRVSQETKPELGMNTARVKDRVKARDKSRAKDK